MAKQVWLNGSGLDDRVEIVQENDGPDPTFRVRRCWFGDKYIVRGVGAQEIASFTFDLSVGGYRAVSLGGN